MNEYHLVRIWQLKPEHTGTELEALIATGYLEMQRWIPGVKHITLLRTGSQNNDRYILTSTFSNYQAYTHWRQVEEEAPDYWERYAAITMQWEQTCFLLEEYAGETVLDIDIVNEL